MISIRRYIYFYFVFNFYTSVFASADIEDDSKNVIQLIEKFGYPVEEHIITTQDGYILSIYRLPNPKAKESILLIHGLMGASSDFILLGPGNSLSFMLYENGYDVWILNCRGTRYSQNHTSYESSGSTSKQYWNFSFHEMGIYDLPSTVDYILDTTNRTQIIHFGHSQGTTVMFIMLAERPEYNKKIKASFAAAPSVYICHATNRLIRFAMQFVISGGVTNVRKQFGDLNVVGIIPSFLHDFLKINCLRSDLMKGICLSLLHELVDASPSQVDPRSMRLGFGLYPHGGSLKSLLHFAQGVMICKFRKFQEDPNIVPEDYNLQNVDVPIYAFIAQNDTIQDPRDSMNLKSTLPNGFEQTNVIENFGHGDFAIARDAPRLVFNKVLEILNSL